MSIIMKNHIKENSSTQAINNASIVQMTTSQRDHWGGWLQFILTCVGYAVGLGNVWRFPYLCYKNGGGAFLIPYVISLILLGLPLFFMEMIMGQYSGLGPVKVWNMNPLFKGVGIATIVISGLICLYYNVIVAYCLFYFFASLRIDVPWKDCNNDWNTCQCFEQEQHNNYTAVINSTQPPTEEQLESLFNATRLHCRPNLTELLNRTETSWSSNSKWVQTEIDHYFNSNYLNSPSEEYFNNYVLDISSGIDDILSIKWDLCLCLLLAWLIVFAVLIKGIKSLGKVVYFTAIFPYIILTALLIRGVTLEGAIDGILFYISPKWEKLLDIQVWSDAAVQIFYSVGVSQGGLIAMSSYNKFHNNCLRDAIMIPVINCLTSFYSGFAIFSMLGFMAHKKGVSVAKVATDGPGLIFVAYPESLANLPISPLWALLFFMMMSMVGLSTMFSMTETVLISIMDGHAKLLRAKWQSIFFRFSVILLFFLLSLPMVTKGGMYMLNILDNYVGGFPMLIVGFFQIVGIIGIYGYKNFASNIEMMLGRRPLFYFTVCWCFITPVLLLALIIAKSIQYIPLTYGNYIYPDWSFSFAWLCVGVSVSWIPVWFLYYLLREGLWELLKVLASPLESWGPSMKTKENIGMPKEGIIKMTTATTKASEKNLGFRDDDSDQRE